MGKLSTEKSKEFKRAQQIFAEFSVQHIKEWTQAELKKFRTEPIVIPIGNYGFFIGSYIVQGIDQTCWQVEQRDNKVLGFFTSKKAAILYCLYNVKQMYHKADELLNLDTKLGRLDSTLKHYEYSLNFYSKRSDSIKHSILLNRYIDAKIKRRVLLDNLKKTINSAKYMNFGKDHYEIDRNGR